VALIEAGQENPYDIGRSQGSFFLTWGIDKNWSYETMSQSFLGGRVIQHPRGRAIGPHLSD
jgi:choline dehydrogenase-like flavoprotein